MLDGFPRTVAQAKALDEMLSAQGLGLSKVVSFLVDQAELVSRLSGRLVCSKCGASFHEVSRPPVKAGTCDSCGSPIIKRDDDRPEVVQTRLETFKASTKPVEEFYRNSGRLSEIDAKGSEKEINQRILKAIGGAP